MNPCVESFEVSTVSAILQPTMALRTTARPLDNVIDTSADLRQCHRHEVAPVDQTVDIDNPPPTSPDLRHLAIRWAGRERPAELRNVLNSPPGSKLFPVDHTQVTPIDDHIARLQVIVDQALVARREVSRDVMKVADHRRESVEEVRSPPPVVDGLPRKPGQNLIASVKTKKTRRPSHADVGQATKREPDEVGVGPRRSANGSTVARHTAMVEASNTSKSLTKLVQRLSPRASTGPVLPGLSPIVIK